MPAGWWWDLPPDDRGPTAPAGRHLLSPPMPYVALFLVVLRVNLLPAFGAPTWTVLVFARLNWHMNPVALVVLGAVAAAGGRYLLALGASRFRSRLSEKRRENLQAAPGTRGLP